MRICFVGLDNLPVLASEYRQHMIGGESVQQTLLARELARRGHAVSMVTLDLGQPDGAEWHGIRVFAAYPPEAGVPLLRFVHPRWTGLWSALARADAEVYYTSCAGVQVGLLAMFCRREGRKFVFRSASDSDCDPGRLLIQYARDRRLYEYGLRRADAILVQSAAQAAAMERNYGLASRVARMLVERPAPAAVRDIDVLWVGNIRQVKRPERILEIAARLPRAQVHLAGGSMPGEEGLYRDVLAAARALPNVTFHGRLSYWNAAALYARAKVLVNTSDVEGFPNAYLQAWSSGVPVVTLIDPDRVIERERLGVAAPSVARLGAGAMQLLADSAHWSATSRRCRDFVAREYGEDKVLPAYLDAFEQSARVAAPGAVPIASRTRHA
jgi:glycosyltransferase involved in cell wall biosynthesis